MMETCVFGRTGLNMLLLLAIWLEVKAQSAPCTTPTKSEGLCVSIHRCRNINNAVRNPIPPPKGIAKYIKKAACTLSGVERSICCQPTEVIPSKMDVRSSTTEKTSLLPVDCGKLVSDRIANGNVTNPFDYPWMALLRYKKDGNILEGCGGSLINERYVLTAAHCLRTKSTLKLDHVRLGEHTINQDEDCIMYKIRDKVERDCADPVEDYAVESFVVHSEYNRPKYSNDIGLVRLGRKVEMQDHIRPICLPVGTKLRSLLHERYIVTGWGTTEEQKGSEVLLQATLPRVDNAVCQKKMAQNRLNVQLTDRQMCVGGENQVDACRGDSGGPLGFSTKIEKSTRFVQYGIVSAGVESCGSKSIPGIYCRVGSYMDWILENIMP